jgi:mannose-6-phosphate isomerase-like protein (cupin superfamily)
MEISVGPTESEPAPDGSTIFPLVRTSRASAGLIELAPGEVSTAVRHRTVEEIWYVLEGFGQLWRWSADPGRVDDLAPGVCVTIPVGASFQFRCTGDSPLRMLMITMPPWPGEAEAESVSGYWD